jgi:hypothetical protein
MQRALSKIRKRTETEQGEAYPSWAWSHRLNADQERIPFADAMHAEPQHAVACDVGQETHGGVSAVEAEFRPHRHAEAPGGYRDLSRPVEAVWAVS